MPLFSQAPLRSTLLSSDNSCFHLHGRWLSPIMYKLWDINQPMQWLHRLLNIMVVCMFHEVLFIAATSKTLRGHIASWLSVHPCVCVFICLACCILGTKHDHIWVYHQNYLKSFVDSLCVFSHVRVASLFEVCFF